MSNAKEQFLFDAVGNRTSASNAAGTATYSYVSGCNRLASFGSGTSVGMNAAGCVTSIVYSATQTVSLAWDGRYPLTAVATNGTVAEAYGYDALNRRAWTSNSTDGVVWHIYDGWQVVADVDATGGVLRTYSWMPGQVDRLLTLAVTTGGVTNVYYAITDQIGTIHALADTNGVIVEAYTYDAWGQVLAVRDGAGYPLTSVLGLPTSGVGNRYLFQGREDSWATGMYNFRNRWYDPVTGRWLSNDPIGTSGGLNQYMFCGNNPVNFRDPLGMDWMDDFAGSPLGRQFWSMDKALASMFLSTVNSVAVTAYVPCGGRNPVEQAAHDLMRSAAEDSGWAMLDEACAGKGAKRAYIGAIGLSAVGASGALIAGAVDAATGIRVELHGRHFEGCPPHLQGIQGSPGIHPYEWGETIWPMH